MCLGNLPARYKADLNKILYPTWSLRYSRGAHLIDTNNREAHPMSYEQALESAYLKGLRGEPLSDRGVFDLLEEWHGCRTIRGMHVTLSIPAIVPPPPCNIYRALKDLVGTEEYADTNWTIMHSPGSAEEAFTLMQPKAFLAWFWIEYLSIQVQMDGNKRAAAMLLMYWLGRMGLDQNFIMPSGEWASCLKAANPIQALAKLM